MKRSLVFIIKSCITLAASLALCLAVTADGTSSSGHAINAESFVPYATPPSQAKTCKGIGFPPNRKSTLPADFPAEPTGIDRCGLHGNENVFLNRAGLNLDEILVHYQTELRVQGYRATIRGRKLQFSHSDAPISGSIWSATPSDPPVGYRITFKSGGE